MVKDQYFVEKSFFDGLSYSFKIKEVLHEEQSPWQKIQVFDTSAVGKLLVLDGKTMISEKDEFVYHEVISHIPAGVSRKLEKVLIIGGGDGGVVREFTKYPSIKEIHLVEIDERVIEVSKKFFPDCAQGLSDPRVKIIPTDGIKYVEKLENEYDIIIVDSTDPEDFAKGLFTSDFYSNVNKALTEQGIMVAQTENPFLDEYGIKNIYDALRISFPIVKSYWAPITIYPGVYWTFAFCSKKYHETDLNPAHNELMNNIEKDLKWYNRNWHKNSAFALSNFHKKMIGDK